MASRTGLSRPAAVRLLEALVSDSIVIRDSRTKKYRLGLRLHEWATKVAHALTPLSIARRELIRLTSDCRRSFYLFVLEETDAVMVEGTEYLDGQALTKPISTHMLWYVTASGKAIAAFSPEDIFKSLMDRVDRDRKSVEIKVELRHQII